MVRYGLHVMYHINCLIYGHLWSKIIVMVRQCKNSLCVKLRKSEMVNRHKIKGIYHQLNVIFHVACLIKDQLSTFNSHLFFSDYFLYSCLCDTVVFVKPDYNFRWQFLYKASGAEWDTHLIAMTPPIAQLLNGIKESLPLDRVST